jgi:hypothetical protein
MEQGIRDVIEMNRRKARQEQWYLWKKIVNADRKGDEAWNRVSRFPSLSRSFSQEVSRPVVRKVQYHYVWVIMLVKVQAQSSPGR